MSKSTPLALHVRSLRKSFAGTVAVDNLDLDLAPGQVLALLGPNGAGKTTTVEACEGFFRPDSGTVEVLGHDPIADRDIVRCRIGMMLQGGGAYPAIRVREMISLVASYYRDPLDVDWLLAELGLEQHGKTAYRRLSGGQQQRLSLACAIVGRPELLFLDEPTAGLDAQSRMAVWDLIRAFRRDGAAVVLTTHLMDEAAELADFVVIIDGGSCVAAGTPDELSRHGGRKGVRVSTATQWDAESAASELRSSGALGQVTSIGERTLLIEGEPDSVLIASVAQAAHRQNQLIVSLDGYSRSLEDVFFDVTGRDVR